MLKGYSPTVILIYPLDHGCLMVESGHEIQNWVFGCLINAESLIGDDNPNSDWYSLYYNTLSSEDSGVYKIVWPKLVETLSLDTSNILYIGGNPQFGPLRDRLCDHIEGGQGANRQQQIRTEVIQKIASNSDLGVISVEYIIDNLNPKILEDKLLAKHREEFGRNPPLNSPFEGREELLSVLDIGE
jgi:hypothetical protein